MWIRSLCWGEAAVPGVVAAEQFCLSSLKPTLWKNYPGGMSGSLRSVVFDVVVSIDYSMEVSLGDWFGLIMFIWIL